MVFVAYRHGLRASELVDLRWYQVDFRTATLHVRRVGHTEHASDPR
jgi:integrase